MFSMEVTRLIERCRQGDADALGELYKAYAQKMRVHEHSSSTRSLSPIAMVGLQRRYAPAVQLLKKRLSKEHLVSYDLHYLTGAYPEGDALLELYLHPLDLACFLFGKQKILAVQQVSKDSYLLMLQHPLIVGTLELSTAYTWIAAEETLKVCAKSGIYQLRQLEELTFESSRSTCFGIPTEKISARNKTVKYLCLHNPFSPILTNDQVFTQGFYGEVESFVSHVENGRSKAVSELKSVRDTYELVQALSVTL